MSNTTKEKGSEVSFWLNYQPMAATAHAAVAANEPSDYDALRAEAVAKMRENAAQPMLLFKISPHCAHAFLVGDWEITAEQRQELFDLESELIAHKSKNKENAATAKQNQADADAAYKHAENAHSVDIDCADDDITAIQKAEKAKEKAKTAYIKAKTAADKLALPKAFALTKMRRMSELQKIRDGEPQPTAGAKTILKKWFSERKRGKRKFLWTPEIAKGHIVEDNAIARYAKFKNVTAQKNTETKEDDFFIGTCDANIAETDSILENKSVWDDLVLSDKESADHSHITQGVIYMHLYGRKNLDIAYCLENTPQTDTREDEISFGWKILSDAMWANGDGNFDSIPNKNRIKIFSFQYDADAQNLIEKLQKRVLICRKYISKLENEWQNPHKTQDDF